MDVTFICQNGNILCHSQILSMFSDFFGNKVEGFNKLGNVLEFNYGTSRSKVIKSFFDRLYSIESWIDDLSFFCKLELLQFLHCEGKTVISGLVYQVYNLKNVPQTKPNQRLRKRFG